jgi:hypothetical protein
LMTKRRLEQWANGWRRADREHSRIDDEQNIKINHVKWRKPSEELSILLPHSSNRSQLGLHFCLLLSFRRMYVPLSFIPSAVILLWRHRPEVYRHSRPRKEEATHRKSDQFSVRALGKGLTSVYDFIEISSVTVARVSRRPVVPGREWLSRGPRAHGTWWSLSQISDRSCWYISVFYCSS